LAQKNRVLVIFLIFIFFNRKFCFKFEATEKEKKVSLDCKFFFTLGRRISLTLKNLSLMLYSLFSLTVASNKG